VDANAVTIITAEGEESLPLQPKATLASALADRLEGWLRDAPVLAESPQ
jgi:hypothetical protein